MNRRKYRFTFVYRCILKWGYKNRRKKHYRFPMLVRSPGSSWHGVRLLRPSLRDPLGFTLLSTNLQRAQEARTLLLPTSTLSLFLPDSSFQGCLLFRFRTSDDRRPRFPPFLLRLDSPSTTMSPVPRSHPLVPVNHLPVYKSGVESGRLSL